MGAERLGRYTVLKHLASGGMADVLLARTDGIEGFERHVVLKRIRPEHAKDQRFNQMFIDEARVAGSLHHQNIVQVYDIGEANGEFYFAMEYIHGEDLRKLLSAVSKSRTHMPLGIVCGILSAAASGLHHAHERRDNNKRPLNIVHRDVSPSNILIGYDGSVKVVDFGIAKAAMRQVETRSGSLKGKVSYMSPEQCKGEEIDRRSDVYALGVLLYELATTTRLFKGDNDYLVMDAIVNGKVPLPRVRRGDLPNEMSTIIMKALATDPTRRYQSADELRIALDQFALKHNLTASTAALGNYMQQIFGGRPEPWLDNATGDGPNIDVEAPTQAAGQSWSEAAREAIGEDDTKERVEPVTGPGQGTDPNRSGSRRSGIANAVAVADTLAPPISTRETRTSMKLGWEVRDRLAAASRGKLVWFAVPLLVLAGFAIAKLIGDDSPPPVAASQSPPAVVTAPAPAPAPAAAPIVEPSHPLPAVRVAGPDPEAPPPQVVAAPAAPEPESTHTKKPRSSRTKKEPENAKPPSPAPEPAPRPAPTVPTPQAPPAPAVAVAPPPAPAPPKIVEPPPMPTLSSSTVAAVASDHSRQLAACEGSATLHGDVAVHFQIDGAGKVVKSQLSSSIKNGKVAGCILKAVQSWKFPKPQAGSAKGVYSISYQ